MMDYLRGFLPDYLLPTIKEVLEEKRFLSDLIGSKYENPYDIAKRLGNNLDKYDEEIAILNKVIANVEDKDKLDKYMKDHKKLKELSYGELSWDKGGLHDLRNLKMRSELKIILKRKRKLDDFIEKSISNRLKIISGVKIPNRFVHRYDIGRHIEVLNRIYKLKVARRIVSQRKDDVHKERKRIRKLKDKDIKNKDFLERARFILHLL